MKKTIYIFLLLFSFGCNKKENDGGAVLPRQKFISLLIHMYRIEGRVSGEMLVDNRNQNMYRAEYIDLFRKNGTDSSGVRQTFNFYKSKPEELKLILQEVNAALKSGN